MNKSDSIVNIAASLVKAQKNIGSAVKGAANPFYKSKYADLGSVMEACKEALNEQGITVLQPVLSEESGDYVETILLHETGEFISSRMKLVLSKQDMQAYGSSVSYARRYGLQSMVFIPAADDDAEGTMNRSPAKQEAPKSAPLASVPPAATKPSSFKGPSPAPVTTTVVHSNTPSSVTTANPAAKSLNW